MNLIEAAKQQEPSGILRTLVMVHPDGTETWKEEPYFTHPSPVVEEIERLRKVKAQAEQVVICDSWRSEECYDELWKLKEMLEAE